MVLLHIIINERAGNGRSKKVWDEIRQSLTISYTEHLTLYQGHACEIASEISRNAINVHEQVVILAVGGDGTIHEVINGIKGYQNIIIGSVKAGSGNDFSRGYFSFHSASQINEFIRNTSILFEVKDCGIVKIGEQEEKGFINNSGIGFDAFVAFKTNQSKMKSFLNKLGLGKLSYVYYLLLSFFTFKLFEITLEYKGVQKKYKNVWFVTVSNQPYFGGGMKISPTSQPDDGLIELTIVHNLSRVKLLFIFITVFFGTHTKFREVEQFKDNHFTLTMNNKLHCHADGEHIGYTKENVKVMYKLHSQRIRIAKLK